MKERYILILTTCSFSTSIYTQHYIILCTVCVNIFTVYNYNTVTIIAKLIICIENEKGSLVPRTHTFLAMALNNYTSTGTYRMCTFGCAVLLCLVVCLTLLASFFLSSFSHLSLKHVLCEHGNTVTAMYIILL